MNITTFAKRLCLLVPLIITPAAWAAEQMTPAAPQLAAKSYVLMDATSGNVLVENNGDQRLAPASLTKLMTAYIATLEIRRGQIGENDPVTISENAWRTGGSRMFIKVAARSRSAICCTASSSSQVTTPASRSLNTLPAAKMHLPT